MSNRDYIGKEIEIVCMAGEPDYAGRRGIVQFVDDIGQLHGTWGGCALIPGEDAFRVVEEDTENGY